MGPVLGFLGKQCLHILGGYHLLLKEVGARLGRLYGPNYFGKLFTPCLLKCRDYFLSHKSYLISLCTVYRLRTALYFFKASLSGVFFLFFSVEYLDVPGTPILPCSVHSRITCTLLPFLLAITNVLAGSAPYTYR